MAVLAACSSGAGGTGTPTVAPGAGQALVALADVPVGGAVSTTTSDGAKILVAQPTAGEAVAFSAICTHRGCTVAPQDTVLHCPCHGSEFDPSTGQVLRGPAKDPLPGVAVKVQDGEVVTA